MRPNSPRPDLSVLTRKRKTPLDGKSADEADHHAETAAMTTHDDMTDPSISPEASNGKISPRIVTRDEIEIAIEMVA